MAAWNSRKNESSFGNEIYSNLNDEDQDVYEDADPPPGPRPRYVPHPTKLGQENTQQPKSSSQQPSQACQSAGLLQDEEQGSKPKQKTKPWNGRWKCAIILLIVGFFILAAGSAMGLASFIEIRKAQPLCVLLTHIAGGTVSVTGQKSGDVAVYTCSTGHRLVGLNVRKCQDNGEWSASQPSCATAASYCGSLSDISHGGVTLTARAGGDVAVYTCSSGYNLVGTNVRKCQKTGRWSGSTPTCRTATCSSLSNISKGKVSVTGQATGDIAVYTCLPGYNLVGDKARKCQDNGQWSGFEPRCTATDMVNKLKTTIAFSTYMDKDGAFYPTANQTIPFNKVIINVGNNFDKATSKFRCPVKGIYAFWFNLYTGALQSNSKKRTSAELVINGSRLSEAYCRNDDSDQVQMMCGNFAVTECSAQSQVWVRSVFGDSKVYGRYDKETTFVGFLIQSL